ncbi:MAG: hypothetical protein JNJ59_01940 [Deltaproteobacteria bacterium]|nr:hypothetical protein [Deltaproteobacteria bacterium]
MFWLGTFGLALGGCPSDAPDPTPTGKVTITEAGTGDPNAEPLWPLRVGYQARFEAATWFIARDLDRDGTRVFVLQSVVRTPNVVPEIIGALRAETGASESWIGESKDGLLLYGTAGQERLPYAELLVPATVRDGQRWKVTGGGETLGEGVVTGGAVEDTIFGRQRTWTVAFTPTAVTQGGFYATFAEGHGLIALRQGDGPDDVSVPVIAATLPDDAGPAPAPVALTPMRSLSPLGDGAPLATTNTPARAVCGGESGTGFPNVDGGDVLDDDLRARWGFGGTYLSAIERPEGGFRLRLGGYTLTCIAINSGTLSLWYARPLVYSAVLDRDALTLDPKPDRYGHNPENAQDARTSVWRPEGTAPVAPPAMTGLAFHPVAASGERMTGLFWEPPPDPFTPPAGYQFAHSGIGTLLGPAGNPLSMGFADGIYGMEWYLLPNQTGWWFYPQQPTAQNPAVYWPTGFLPPSAYPLVLASGDFSRDPAGKAGWTPYLTSTFGELTSGQVAYLPEGGYDGTPFTGSAADALRYFARYEYSEARIGSLTADVLSTVLRRDNTRETLLVGLSDGAASTASSTTAFAASDGGSWRAPRSLTATA